MAGKKVLQELVDAHRANKRKRLRTLCQEHRGVILANFRGWQGFEIPRDGDADDMLNRIQAMSAVAKIFEDHLGDDSLTWSLSGDHWQETLNATDALMAVGALSNAVNHLGRYLASGETLPPHDNRLVTTALAKMSELYYLLGDHDGARSWMIDALRSAMELEDGVGVQLVLRRLQRYAQEVGDLHELEQVCGMGMEQSDGDLRHERPMWVVQLAEVIAERGRPEEALAQLDSAVEDAGALLDDDPGRRDLVLARAGRLRERVKAGGNG